MTLHEGDVERLLDAYAAGGLHYGIEDGEIVVRDTAGVVVRRCPLSEGQRALLNHPALVVSLPAGAP